MFDPDTSHRLSLASALLTRRSPKDGFDFRAACAAAETSKPMTWEDLPPGIRSAAENVLATIE